MGYFKAKERKELAVMGAFWREKPLHEMSRAEWESLCDGCGLCCLIKLEDEDTGALHYTRMTCCLLDTSTCRCSDYDNRHQRVSDCLSMSVETVRKIPWLPGSCAYVRLLRGQDLPWWHPLVSGDTETVHQSGISVRGWTVSEEGISSACFERYLIKKPFAD